MPKNPMDAKIGARLKMRRLEMNMAQEKLGEAVGITFQQIQKYEKGANRMSSSRIAQIAAVLEVSPTYFFDGVAGKIPAPMPSPEVGQYFDFLYSRDGKALALAFLKIRSSEKRKAIAYMVDIIAEE